MHSPVKFGILLLLLAFAAACTPSAPIQLPTAAIPPTRPALETYQTRTPTPAATQPVGTPTLLPTLTPTPRLHEISLGETLLTIAWRYDVSLEALKNANPEVDPNVLIVGQQLVIPNTAPTPEVLNPSPTPLALTLSQPYCIADASGGLWCLLSAGHTENGSENIAVEVRLGGEGSVETLKRLAVAPLNHAAAGETMPMAVYFSPQDLADAPFTAPYQAQSLLVQALPLEDSTGRYLPVSVEEQQIIISPDDLSADISGQLTLNASSPAPAGSIWLVAALYGEAGQLQGFRRWESTAPLDPGGSVAFSLQVYCLDNTPIKNVVILIEAVP